MRRCRIHQLWVRLLAGARSRGRLGGEVPGAAHLKLDPVVVVVHTLMMLASVAQFAVFPLLPQLERTLGVSSFGLAILVAVPTVVMIGGAVPAGRLCDRWGARSVSCVGATLLAASCGLQTASALVPFASGRVVFGLAMTALWTGGPAWLHASWPHSTARVGAVVTSAAAGTIAGPTLSGLVADRLGVGWPFLLTGVACAVVAVAVLLGRGGRPNRSWPRPEPPQSSAADLLRSPEATAALSAMVAVGVASGAIQFLMPLQLGRTGHSASAIGGVLCAAGLVYVVSSTTTTRSRETTVTTYAVVMGCVVMGLLILPAAFGNRSTWILVGCLLLFTVPRAVLNTLAYRLAARSNMAAAGNIGFVVGSLNLVWSAAASAGPLGAGWLDDRLGAWAGFLGTAVASITVGLLLVHLTRTRLLHGTPAIELYASASDSSRGRDFPPGKARGTK